MCRTSRRTRRTRYPPIDVLEAGADAIDRSTFGPGAEAARPNRPFSRRGRSRRKTGETSRSSSSTFPLDIRARRSADDSSTVDSPAGLLLASSPDSTSELVSKAWPGPPPCASFDFRTDGLPTFCDSSFDASGRGSSRSSKSSGATGPKSTGPIPEQPGAPPIRLLPTPSHSHRHLESPVPNRKPTNDLSATHAIAPPISTVKRAAKTVVRIRHQSAGRHSLPFPPRLESPWVTVH
jgi:hypothetical protein